MPIVHNIIANYLGQIWSAAMGLVFIPLYIKYLGIEAYGLIGLFGVLNAWLSLLDMGMTPTLNREMARFTAGSHSPQSISDLLRSIEMVCFSIAIVISFGVWSGSDFLASDWLKAEKLPVPVVAKALTIIAIVIALRFIEGIYRGALFGLQRQVWYNSVNALMATVRHGGAVFIIAFLSETVEAYFYWQAVISVVCIGCYSIKVHSSLPKPLSSPRFSLKALSKIRAFAGGMMSTTILSLMLTQIDKVLLSKLISLEAFGYYTMAAAAAGALSIISSPLAQAVFPRMVELSTLKQRGRLISIYHLSCQIVVVAAAPIVMVVCFYSREALMVWSNNPVLASNAAPVLVGLTIGNFLNGVMVIPYMLQLAYGWTGLAVKANLVAVVLLVPMIIYVVPEYGAQGASWVWASLNLGYVIFIIQLMHRRILQTEKLSWYLNDLALPCLGAVMPILAIHFFYPLENVDRLYVLLYLVIVGAISMITSAFFANRLRSTVIDFIVMRIDEYKVDINGNTH